MNETERALGEALNDLERAAAAARAGGGEPEIGSVLRRIDALAEQWPGPRDPQLAHYLAQKSYGKARVRLEEIERLRHTDQLPGS